MVVGGSTPGVTDVEVDRAHGVTVTFDDAVVCTFTLPELRTWCPCATCRGQRDQGLVPWPPAARPDATVTVAAAELVGAWGISFEWSDGHGTGIYPWERLRAWHDHGRHLDEVVA